MKILYTDPHIFTVSNFLSDDECNHFITKANDINFARSMVSDDKQGMYSNGRTSSNVWLKHNTDEITLDVGERISKIVNIPLENAENYQVIRYNLNQEYRQHYDTWSHDNSEKTYRCMKWGGARLKTAIVYLNDVTKGGETKFTKLNISVSPEKGKLLVFDNVYKNTHDRHLLSEHAGLPVLKGEKYAFNLWFKECKHTMLYRDYNKLYYKKPNMDAVDTLL